MGLLFHPFMSRREGIPRALWDAPLWILSTWLWWAAGCAQLITNCLCCSLPCSSVGSCTGDTPPWISPAWTLPTARPSRDALPWGAVHQSQAAPAGSLWDPKSCRTLPRVGSHGSQPPAGAGLPHHLHCQNLATLSSWTQLTLLQSLQQNGISSSPSCRANLVTE